MVRISVLLFLLGSVCLFAQDAVLGHAVDISAVEYLHVAGDQSALYYGKEQEGYWRVLNYPYLHDAQYVKARLSYRRIIYPEALLRLDWHRNELVVMSPDKRNVVLFPENVDYVELHGKHIIYFRRDNLPGCPSSGYYILLYSGQCKVFEKQTASMVRNTNNTSRVEYYFSFSTNFYLFKDGVYHNIRNKRGLLKVLHPYKRELNRFISSNNLRFRHNAQELISRTVSEYEKLSGLQ